MKNILFTLLFFTGFCFSQQASLDLSFNTADIGNGLGYGPNDYITKMAVQPDGKIIILGRFTHINGVPRKNFARLNADSTLDTTFDIGTGFASLPNPNGIGPKGIALQSDGKLIVVGYFISYNGYATNNIVRLNPDGSVDPSFVTIFSSSQTLRTVHVQSGDKILVSGDFTDFSGHLRINVARLLADGNLDIAFNTGSGINGYVNSL